LILQLRFYRSNRKLAIIRGRGERKSLNGVLKSPNNESPDEDRNDVTYGDRTEKPTGPADTETNHKGDNGEEDGDVEEKEDEGVPRNVERAEEESEEALKHLVIS
jgi:hypothetical protein